jgi:hypothetical protein
MIRNFRVPSAWFDWLTLRRSITIIALVVGVYAWYAWTTYRHGGKDAMTGVVTLAPLVALVIAAPLIAFVFEYAGWVEERAWAPWQGIYHAFDDHQIRVTEARDLLWFSSADVHAVLGLAPRPGRLKTLRVSECRIDDDLGVVLSNAGLVALFGRSTDRKTIRLIAWAERDVARPWRNRRSDVKVAYAMRAGQDASRSSAASVVDRT